ARGGGSDRGGRIALPANERKRLGSAAVAGDGPKYRQSCTNVHHGGVHGSVVWTYGRRRGRGADRARGACFRVCAAPRVFADPLRRGERWQFSGVVRSAPSETSDSNALAFDAGRDHTAVLYLSAARGHHYVGGRSYPVSILAAGNGYAAAEASRGKEDARISYAALSAPGIVGAGRLRLHSIFAAGFLTGDADGRAHSDRGSHSIWASLLEDAEQDLANRLGRNWFEHLIWNLRSARQAKSFCWNLTGGETHCLIGEWTKQRQRRSETYSLATGTPIACCCTDISALLL